MLIIYNKQTGEVVDNTGTSSEWPEGPPDELAWVNVDSLGLDRNEYDLLRLNDEEDADLVLQVMGNDYRVDPTTKNIVVGDPWTIPTPPEDPRDQRLQQLEAAVDQLILDQLMGG